MYTINPKTGKRILVNGPTYLKLAKDSRWASRLSPSPSPEARQTPKGKSRSGSKSGGCANQRKYIGKGIPESKFCGPEGGSCPYTFPVNTPKRARAALAYSRHAPNPEGIRECVYRRASQEGWLDRSTGKLMMSGRSLQRKKTPKKSPSRGW